MSKIKLVRDVLDKQMLDKNECEIGRVDGIVLEFPEDAPPRVARLELGGPVLARDSVIGPSDLFAQCLKNLVRSVCCRWSFRGASYSDWEVTCISISTLKRQTHSRGKNGSRRKSSRRFRERWRNDGNPGRAFARKARR